MSTIKQWLQAEIKRSNKKLLLAAVVFICLSWSLAGPVKGIERIALPFFVDQNEENIVLENEISQSPKSLSFVTNYLIGSMTANSLASLTDQLDLSETPEQFLYQEGILSTFQNNAIIAQRMPTTFISQEARSETTSYVVQEGDAISSIAASFGISLNTLLWANSLKETSLIRPGDELTILPISGLVHRVKSGDTIGGIATKYKGNTEKIIAFSDLPADGSIQIGQKLIVPDGQMPIVASSPTRVATYSQVTGPGTGKSRIFPYGQCTWYVAQKRYVPWSGHAKSWLVNAQAYGFKTGSAPQVGAAAVLSEGGWLGRVYGHVAYVEAIKGSWVTISEMNYTCYACKSVRTLHINDNRIRGYIY
ncbi:MAG: LysM peptidoglycan-binding domain-containing protein [Candidatus Portnoybacteria bacterium]